MGIGVAGGVYLELESNPEHRLKLESLSDKRAGIELVAVRHDDARRTNLATVFVPEGKLSTFVKKVEAYRDEETPSGGDEAAKPPKPKNKALVESIGDVRLAILRSFWTDEPGCYPTRGVSTIWEVWLRNVESVTEQVRSLGRLEGVRIASPRFDFVELAVVLVEATAEALSAALDMLDVLAELRLAKSPASFLARGDRRAALDALTGRITPPTDAAPAVCLLDMGVERGHPLIEGLLSESDDHLYDPSWRRGDQDGHGTGMAGIALYRDLAPLLSQRGPIDLDHRLESVKAIDPGKPHDPLNFGDVMQECVARVEVAAPDRNRTLCLTVTTPDDRDRGRPSLWSAAIDDLCAGTSDGTRRLFVSSTGNIQPVDKHLGYPEVNLTEQVHNPAQAWNALTVGAYTERVVIDEVDFIGWKCIAEPGALSPTSSTSVTWDRQWPVKPEIVLEGGNSARDPAGQEATQPDSLSLLTTGLTMRGGFAATGDTSAAAAAAARMSAIIMARYPDLWPETVRALLVDSAEWTPAMMAHAPPSATRTAKERALRMFGYGVPNLDVAAASAANDLTLIVQSELQPFDAKGRMNDMHLHELPWPRDVLASLGDANVELRVTLSYFVEASPGRRGWGRKHRYASHGLRFDVQTPRSLSPSSGPG